MRLLTLVAVASLALATPGCTLIGAGIGAAIPVAPDGPGDSSPAKHASRGDHALLGGVFGFMADALVVGLIMSAVDSFNRDLRNFASATESGIDAMIADGLRSQHVVGHATRLPRTRSAHTCTESIVSCSSSVVFAS